MFRKNVFFIVMVLLIFLTSFSISNDKKTGLTPEDLSQYWQSHFNQPSVDPIINLPYLPYLYQLQAKGIPDECFRGIGDPANNFVPAGIDCQDCLNQGGMPKTNQGYVFGLAQTPTDLWFGTSPNQLCTVLGTYIETLGLGLGTTLESQPCVCEFGISTFRNNYTPVNPLLTELPEAYGDWRPPRIYKYSKTSLDTIDITPNDPLLQDTYGMRSAGSHDNIVILGGPNLIAAMYQLNIGVPGRAINLFAFRADTGEYLGSKAFPHYTDIRKWIVAEGELYTSVQYENGTGRVLRWDPQPEAKTIDDILNFEEVGLLDAEGAELTYHEGRLFITTWNLTLVNMCGLYMSPLLDGSLTNEDYLNWRKVWAADDYEPDPVVASTYFGGAVASYDGWVYWGTINFPLVGFFGHLTVYGLTDPLDIALAMSGTWRNIIICRGRNFDTESPEIELLYGMSDLPAYNPATQQWALTPNMTGPPQYGLAGFGNICNAYTWTMQVYRGQLFVGTMDFSYMVFEVGIPGLLGIELPLWFTALASQVAYGADLYCFPSSYSPAVPINLSGVGNPLNYGIRTMAASPQLLYLGSANPMNTAIDGCDDPPQGGWELIRLSNCGDLNMDFNINILDAMILSQYLSGNINVVTGDADVNMDTLVTSTDLDMLLNISVGNM